ncbi:MAG: thioredoxin domain-containing protein [Planctomycetaceae bacterium]
MYMPKDHNRDDRVYVDVKPTGKSMVLVLTGYFGAEWHLNVDPKADVRRVIVTGYYKHELAEPRPDVPIAMLTYFPKADKSNRNFFWAYAWRTAEGRELSRRLKDLTGLEVTTFQGEYSATRFIVDGQRGRDVVNDTTTVTASEAHPSFLGGLLQDLIGSNDTDDRPPKLSQRTDVTSAAITVKESQTPAIRRSLETAREQAESQHRDAEQASLQAATAYRDELSQAAPDPQALGERRTKLQQAVKAAFDAQMLLQQIRLQLAQQDLADVQARYQQRRQLADRIIERRVADLMSGQDLDWLAKVDKAKRADGRLTRATGEEHATTNTAAQNRDAIPPLRVGLHEEDDTDPELDGEWRLERVTGLGVVGHETGLFLQTEAGKWSHVRGTRKSNFGRRIDPKTAPATVDIVRLDLPNAPPIWSGIYKIEGNTLTIAWAPSDGSAPRPNDFSGSVGTVQTWKRVEKLPTFATPQELVDYVSKMNAGNSEDSSKTMEQMFALVTEDEINRFAGLMLRTTSMMQMAAGLGAAFGNSEGADGNAEGQQVADFLQTVGHMNLIVDKYRSQDPSPEALAAYQQIAGGLNLSMLFQGGQPSPSQSVDDYSRKLRLAAGVLSDPRSFVTELTHELQNLEAIQASGTNVANAQQKAKPDWQVTVNGDTAVATDGSIDPDSSSSTTVTSLPARMELIKVGDTWKISSLIPDRVIMEMQHGPTVSNSSSDSSGPSSPSMAPVTTFSGINAAVASTDLVPFVQLNGSNTTTSTVYAEEQTAVAIGTDTTNGRYINRHLKQGEQITADMLIDKPRHDQIMEFWLEEAVAGRDVFESMKSLQHRYHRTPLYAMEFPFSDLYAKRFNEKLPDWTPDYLQAATERLQRGAPVDWSQKELSILKSLGELIHYQTVKEKHDVATIGELLTTFVSSDFSPIADELTDAVENSKAAHSSWLLGELVRLTGRLPKKALEAQPLDEATAAKLNLLETMVLNSADDTWISQERRRLCGLAEEAPVQALKLLLAVKPITSQGVLESWIFALSSEETYSAWRSSPNEHYSPPLDPVIAIAVAESLAGKDEVTDNNLALLFQPNHPGYMFARHVDDLLSGESAYRDSVLQLLVSIYSKSKSPHLKAGLAKMAPSVPVLAGNSSTAQSNTEHSPVIADVPGNILIYFYADYCEPCRQMTPLIQQLADSKTIPVHMWDVTVYSKPVSQLSIDRIPTIVVMRQGQVVGRKCGLMSQDELNDFVKSPLVLADTENTMQTTVAIKAANNEAAALRMPSATAKQNIPLEPWLKDIRSIGEDAVAKRDAALAEVEAALNADDVAQNLAATQALAQTGDVNYDKAKYRERILELCRSSNRDLVTSALYALYNTDRKPEDLALAQEVLSKPEAAWAGHSISHLLMMFGDGEISGKSEEIVLSLLNSADRSVRREALRGLWGAKTSDKLMDRVIELVDNEESHHDAIYFALATGPDKNAAVVDKLIEVLSDPDWNNWDRALWGLGYGVRDSEQRKVAEAMLQMYENRNDPKTREKCRKLVQQYGSPEQIQKLIGSAASETESKP